MSTKGYSDPAKEPPTASPHTVDEPAPPVVTTAPAAERTKDLSNSDESSDEEVRLPPKVQRRAGGARAKPVSPSKNPRLSEPDLSSCTDEDEPPRRGAPNTQPAAPAPAPAPPRKTLKKKRETNPSSASERKSRPRCDSDSDASDVAPSPASGRSRPAPPKPGSFSSPARPPPKKTPSEEERPGAANARRASADRERGGGGHARRGARDAKRGSVEPKKAPVKEEELEERKRAWKEAPLHHGHHHSLKKEDSKADRRKNRKRDGEAGAGASLPSGEAGEDATLPASLSQRLEEPSPRLGFSPFPRKSTPNASAGAGKTSSSGAAHPLLQYDNNGVPKLILSIPCDLIDKLPCNAFNNNLKRCVKDQVNKEVLELRTSGGKAKVRRKRESKSPPNEVETKRKALYSIYRKRQSSLEPEKSKRSDLNADQHEAKSPHVALKAEDLKQ